MSEREREREGERDTHRDTETQRRERETIIKIYYLFSESIVYYQTLFCF